MAARSVFCLLFYNEEVRMLEGVLDVIISFIQNVGFPIACVVAMFWMWDRERQEHKAEAEKWAEAINNNTRVMEKLVERMDEENRIQLDRYNMSHD